MVIQSLAKLATGFRLEARNSSAPRSKLIPHQRSLSTTLQLMITELSRWPDSYYRKTGHDSPKILFSSCHGMQTLGETTRSPISLYCLVHVRVHLYYRYMIQIQCFTCRVPNMEEAADCKTPMNQSAACMDDRLLLKGSLAILEPALASISSTC